MVVKVPVYMVDPSLGVSSPAQITTNTNNLVIADTVTILRLTTDASRTLTGIAGGTAGRELLIQNVGTNDLILEHSSSSSLAANRFSIAGGNNFTVGAGKSVVLVYDAVSSCWRDYGSTSGSASGAAWLPISATGTGSSQNITLPEGSLTEADVYVAVNGLLQTPGVDYTIAGTTLTTTVHSGANIVIRKNLGIQGIGGYGDLAATNNLSDLANPATARTNLGLGNVENKSSATIRSELTLVNIQAALPVSTTSAFWTGTSDAYYASPKSMFDAAVPQVLTDQATITWNAQAGFNAKVTLGGNRTLAAITNPKVGVTYALEILQDATGGRTLTWNSCYDFGATGTPTLSTTASKRDFAFMYCYDAATPKFRVSFSKDS